jgi:hypothetical protein
VSQSVCDAQERLADGAVALKIAKEVTVAIQIARTSASLHLRSRNVVAATMMVTNDPHRPSQPRKRPQEAARNLRGRTCLARPRVPVRSRFSESQSAAAISLDSRGVPLQAFHPLRLTASRGERRLGPYSRTQVAITDPPMHGDDRHRRRIDFD